MAEDDFRSLNNEIERQGSQGRGKLEMNDYKFRMVKRSDLRLQRQNISLHEDHLRLQQKKRWLKTQVKRVQRNLRVMLKPTA